MYAAFCFGCDRLRSKNGDITLTPRTTPVREDLVGQGGSVQQHHLDISVREWWCTYQLYSDEESAYVSVDDLIYDR